MVLFKVPMQRKIQFKRNPLISKNLWDIYVWRFQLFRISLCFWDIEVCLIYKWSYLCMTSHCITTSCFFLNHVCLFFYEESFLVDPNISHITLHVWGLIIEYTVHTCKRTFSSDWIIGADITWAGLPRLAWRWLVSRIFFLDHKRRFEST